MTSSFVTPKEAADMPTCSMKYEISEYEMSMNLDLSVVIEGYNKSVLTCALHTWKRRRRRQGNRRRLAWSSR
jgi:hypothetical protein